MSESILAFMLTVGVLVLFVAWVPLLHGCERLLCRSSDPVDENKVDLAEQPVEAVYAEKVA